MVIDEEVQYKLMQQVSTCNLPKMTKVDISTKLVEICCGICDPLGNRH